MEPQKQTDQRASQAPEEKDAAEIEAMLDEQAKAQEAANPADKLLETRESKMTQKFFQK